VDAADLAYAGAARQAELIAAGRVSAREVVQACLDRIARVDGDLNAFRVVFAERALVEAGQADARRGAGDRRALLGVPVAVKDDTDVAGEATARGSSAPCGPAVRDAEVVRRLRAAGAVVVGKTQVPEHMLWPWTEGEAQGPSRNPWSREHTPGGSSGGSGAAVAAGLCGAALGTDGAGSVRIPAAFCGVFAIKPQRDRIPVWRGASDSWHGLNHLGPIGRTVADAALVLDALADRPPPGGFSAAAASEPGPLRIAVSTRMPPGVVARLGREQRAAVDATADLLRTLGHEVVEHEIDYPPSGAMLVLARYLRGAHDEVATVQGQEHLEARTRGVARLGGRLGPRAMARVRAAEGALTTRVTSVLATADAVLLPGPTGPPFRVGAERDRGALWSLNAAAAKIAFYPMFNATGQPACSVPAGFDRNGLPLAVQLAGRPYDEATLLSLAAQIERARPWADRRPPL
jgi:amidase